MTHQAFKVRARTCLKFQIVQVLKLINQLNIEMYHLNKGHIKNNHDMLKIPFQNL